MSVVPVRHSGTWKKRCYFPYFNKARGEREDECGNLQHVDNLLEAHSATFW